MHATLLLSLGLLSACATDGKTTARSPEASGSAYMVSVDCSDLTDEVSDVIPGYSFRTGYVPTDSTPWSASCMWHDDDRSDPGIWTSCDVVFVDDGGVEISAYCNENDPGAMHIHVTYLGPTEL